jgi:hypothetical protein
LFLHRYWHVRLTWLFTSFTSRVRSHMMHSQYQHGPRLFFDKESSFVVLVLLHANPPDGFCSVLLCRPHLPLWVSARVLVVQPMCRSNLTCRFSTTIPEMSLISHSFVVSASPSTLTPWPIRSNSAFGFLTPAQNSHVSSLVAPMVAMAQLLAVSAFG